MQRTGTKLLSALGMWRPACSNNAIGMSQSFHDARGYSSSAPSNQMALIKQLREKSGAPISDVKVGDHMFLM